MYKVEITSSHAPYQLENIISPVNGTKAETILQDNKIDVGSFLVRPSSIPEHIVLSVKMEDGIGHVRLQRIGTTSGPFYRMIATEEELKNESYSKEQIKMWLQPYPLSVWVEYFLKGANYVDSGKLIIHRE